MKRGGGHCGKGHPADAPLPFKPVDPTSEFAELALFEIGQIVHRHFSNGFPFVMALLPLDNILAQLGGNPKDKCQDVSRDDKGFSRRLFI
jgi:hypothetical protein